jgi:hypothetical protein
LELADVDFRAGNVALLRLLRNTRATKTPRFVLHTIISSA